MKTNICKLSSDNSTFEDIFAEVEKTANYNNLEKKQALHLRLLAEELVGMLPELLTVGSGEFWIENKGKKFEIHVTVNAEKRPTMQEKENMLSVSKSGNNIAAKGIINKIKLISESMLDGYLESTRAAGFYKFYDMGIDTSYPYYDTWSNAWSLNNYKENTSNDKNSDEWDELEKSIIAKLSDDVIVGTVGKKLDIIVKKDFN